MKYAQYKVKIEVFLHCYADKLSTNCKIVNFLH